MQHFGLASKRWRFISGLSSAASSAQSKKLHFLPSCLHKSKRHSLDCSLLVLTQRVELDVHTCSATPHLGTVCTPTPRCRARAETHSWCCESACHSTPAFADSVVPTLFFIKSMSASCALECRNGLLPSIGLSGLSLKVWSWHSRQVRTTCINPFQEVARPTTPVLLPLSSFFLLPLQKFLL